MSTGRADRHSRRLLAGRAEILQEGIDRLEVVVCREGRTTVSEAGTRCSPGAVALLRELWHWLRERPVSESGRLRQPTEGHSRGDRRRSGLMLPTLSCSRQPRCNSLKATSGSPLSAGRSVELPSLALTLGGRAPDYLGVFVAHHVVRDFIEEHIDP